MGTCCGHLGRFCPRPPLSHRVTNSGSHHFSHGMLSNHILKSHSLCLANELCASSILHHAMALVCLPPQQGLPRPVCLICDALACGPHRRPRTPRCWAGRHTPQIQLRAQRSCRDAPWHHFCGLEGSCQFSKGRIPPLLSCTAAEEARVTGALVS